MASVSVSHLILFIASMVVAASVAGVFTDSVGRLSQAVTDQGLDVSQDVRTDVEIISDAGSDAVYDADNETIRLYVKNTGSRRLAAEAPTIDVVVDGRYTVDVAVTPVGDAETWGLGDVVLVEIGEDLALDADHRVQITVGGDREVFEFRT